LDSLEKKLLELLYSQSTTSHLSETLIHLREELRLENPSESAAHEVPKEEEEEVESIFDLLKRLDSSQLDWRRKNLALVQNFTFKCYLSLSEALYR
jgi:hypothetical protein